MKLLSLFQPITQPSIEIFNIKILEPVTSITDILVGITCLFLSYKLYINFSYRNQLFYLSFLYFFLMGLATILGGILGHAFLYKFPFSIKLFGWITSMLSIMCLERLIILRNQSLISVRLFKTLNILNIAEFVLLTSLTIITLNFFIVEAHGTYGILFIVGGLELYHYTKTRSNASLKFLKAVSLSIITAIIHLTKFSINEWLTYLDISHILMIFTSIAFYEAIAFYLKLSSNKNKNINFIHQ